MLLSGGVYLDIRQTMYVLEESLSTPIGSSNSPVYFYIPDVQAVGQLLREDQVRGFRDHVLVHVSSTANPYVVGGIVTKRRQLYPDARKQDPRAFVDSEKLLLDLPG